MDLQHTFTVPAGIDVAWAMVNDLTEIAGCFPGASLGTVDGDSFAGSVKVKLGPISLIYNGTGTFVERDHEAHRAVIEAKGKDKRGNGTAAAKVTATMTGDAESTEVSVITDLQVTGKPAQFGRGVMQDVSDKLLGQFVNCISGKLGTLAEPPAVPTPDPAAEPTMEPVADPAPTTPDPAAQPTTAVPPPPPPPPPPRPSSPPTRPAPPRLAQASPEPEELDMLGTIAPVLVKRYGVPAAVGLVMLIIGILIGRRRH